MSRPFARAVPHTSAAIADAAEKGECLGAMRWLLGFTMLVATLTRLALMWLCGSAFEPSVPSVALALLLGAGYDLLAVGYVTLPLALVLAVLPSASRRRRSGHAAVFGALCVATFLVLFIAAAEVLFWLEFGTRFNFIAVDYLIYTHEVVANLWQSYPLVWILSLLAACSAVLLRSQYRRIGGGPEQSVGRGSERITALLVLCWPVVVYLTTNPVPPHPFDNRYANELARNGVFDFFRAFKSAELDYAGFYPSLTATEADARLATLRADLGQDPDAGPRSGGRRYNVVLISVESLSATYLRHFGSRLQLTPNLDRLADSGLLFTDLYATGTRTVRGLEALALSVPPSPGESIIKRPDNGGLATLGGILADEGYDVRFVYGGDARFDNMRTFFASNGYEVVDRAAIPAANIHHENAWGVADEDVYSQALTEITRSEQSGHASFTHIMTTSNHRPYTYPENRIDLPSGHAGRPGAVKYTDWAIGDFLVRARRTTWFANTVFVIVADHCASSAGKTALPLYRYHIPLIVYAPGIVPPAQNHQLASQIDVAPTVLGLLGLPSPASFFGRDLRVPATSSYAVISTYQELGFLRDNRLVELAPLRPPQVSIVSGHSPDPAAGTTTNLIHDAIAIFQTSANALRSGRLRRTAMANP